MKIYLSGSMRSVEDSNRPLFEMAARVMRVLGHEVFNPSSSWDGSDGLDLGQCFDIDAAMLRSCDAVFVLPGAHKDSLGVAMEKAVAAFLEKDVVEYDEWYETMLGGCSLSRLATFSDDNIRGAVRTEMEI